MSLNSKTVGFIGCGKMGMALIKGLLDSGLVADGEIMGFDVAESDWWKTLTEWGAAPAESNLELVSRSDIVVLAVKPQNVAPVFPEIREQSAGKLFISIVAGLATKTMEQELHPQARVIRAMPNTPCLVRQGASAVARGASATDKDMALAQTLMSSVGQVTRAKEKDMDAVTGMSGTGPAFTFLFMEGLIDAGVRLGLEWDMARQLAMQTVKGAAILAQESNVHLAQLRNEVTSPGGTSAAGLQVMEQAGFKAIISQAVEAASKRSEELGRK